MKNKTELIKTLECCTIYEEDTCCKCPFYIDEISIINCTCITQLYADLLQFLKGIKDEEK